MMKSVANEASNNYHNNFTNTHMRSLSFCLTNLSGVVQVWARVPRTEPSASVISVIKSTV